MFRVLKIALVGVAGYALYNWLRDRESGIKPDLVRSLPKPLQGVARKITSEIGNDRGAQRPKTARFGNASLSNGLTGQGYGQASVNEGPDGTTNTHRVGRGVVTR
jgi:hypothetical protein